jgi:penicillin-binding protein 1C
VKAKKGRKRKLKLLRRTLRKNLRKKLFLWIFFVVVVFCLTFYFFILKDLPLPTYLTSQNVSKATQIFDRNQELLYSVYADKNQAFIPLIAIPKHVKDATIAIEDKDFYKHGAIDLRGILRSIVSIIFRHQIQGGSTITQQLVKNSLLTPERTILRRIKEVILSFATEAIYSKDKILEMYLNQVPYGGTAWGIEAASQSYFGKSAKALTLAQSALLAGLPSSPTTYSPFGTHPELAKKRQKEVLQQLFKQRHISIKEYEKALKEQITFKKVEGIRAPHFALFIKEYLTKKYGQIAVEQEGLTITTSLDLKLQDFVQNTVASEVAKLKDYNVGNGAALITIPKTGEILAMVGSKDYFDTTIDGNVNVTLALRQPGSAIKPINYALGLMNGYTAATPFVDKEICFKSIGQKDYCPVNYDRKWHGVVQMRYALGSSINIPAVKMLKLNGVSSMIATASAMGIKTFTNTDDYGLSLTLGGGEVTMLDMAEAYGVFANGGYRINLHPILKVVDRSGQILEQYNPPPSPIFGKKVLPEGAAFIISDILSDNNARLMAFGPYSELSIPRKVASVKTGTTNDLRDNWTIGYTPSFLVAVWVGNNDNSSMSQLASGITGAAPIWHDIMIHVLKDKPSEPVQRPSSIIQKRICATSGLIPPPDGTPNKCETRFEYFIKGTEPTRTEEGIRKVLIDKTTNDLANPNQKDNVEEKDAWVITDPTGDSYCLTCPHSTPTPTP